MYINAIKTTFYNQHLWFFKRVSSNSN